MAEMAEMAENISGKRTQMFIRFAMLVADHIENYTIPQYGDAPDDEVENWSEAQCVAAIQKYCKRYLLINKRGRLEVLRDMVKIAHFAQLAFNKMNPTNEEICLIAEGETNHERQRDSEN